MKRWIIIAFIAVVFVLGLASNARSQLPQINPVFGTLANLNDALTTRCANGSSTADVYIAGNLSGTVTVHAASDVSMNAGTYQAGVFGGPLWATTAGGTSNTQTLSSFPGHVYIILSGQPWVNVVLTTANSGNATAEITCSTAIARVANAAGGGGGGGALPSFSATLPLSVATPSGSVAYSCGPCMVNPVNYLAMGAWANPTPTAAAQTGIIYFGDGAHPTASPGFFSEFAPANYTSNYSWITLTTGNNTCNGAWYIELDTQGNFDLSALCNYAQQTNNYTVTEGVKPGAGGNPNKWINNLTAGFTSVANVSRTYCTLSTVGGLSACATPTLAPPNVGGAGTGVCFATNNYDLTGFTDIYAPQWSASNAQFTITATLAESGNSVVIQYWCAS